MTTENDRLDEETEKIFSAITWMPETNLPATLNALRSRIRQLQDEARKEGEERAQRRVDQIKKREGW